MIFLKPVLVRIMYIMLNITYHNTLCILILLSPIIFLGMRPERYLFRF